MRSVYGCQEQENISQIERKTATRHELTVLAKAMSRRGWTPRLQGSVMKNLGIFQVASTQTILAPLRSVYMRSLYGIWSMPNSVSRSQS